MARKTGSIVECKNCGKDFEAEVWGDKYCSLKCGEEHDKNYKSRGGVSYCKHCGELFKQRRNRQKYCGQKCQINYEYDNNLRDEKETTKAANEAMREQGLKQFREDPTTKVTARGYKAVYIPAAHPELDDGWMKMHHYVWWKEKGELPPVDDINEKATGKVMHHKDGDKLNNDIDNLEIMSNDEHTEMHQNS